MSSGSTTVSPSFRGVGPSVSAGFLSPAYGFLFAGLVEGAAVKPTHAVSDISERIDPPFPEPINPPIPSPLQAVTVIPTFFPSTDAGTVSSALHESKEQALGLPSPGPGLAA